MTQFTTKYGNKSNGDKLQATDWNNLMSDLDNDINQTTTEEIVTPVNFSSITNGTVTNTSLDLTSTTLNRGYVGLINGVATTTTATDLANIWFDSSTNTIKEKLLGDRVRFGSWYIVTNNLTTSNCSHEFLEIVNSGTTAIKFTDSVVLTMYYGDFKVSSIPLTGGIDAKSSYLIRGKKTNSSNPIIDVVNYDIDISGILQWKGISFKDVNALVLHHKDMTLLNDSSTYTKLINSLNSNPYLIDVIIFNSDKVRLNDAQGDSLGTPVFGSNPAYTLVNDSIIKDLYSLDPAKLAFRTLVKCTAESTAYRTDKIAQENIPLNSKYFLFPHSNQKYDVTKFTPKSSGLKKNILTDKTTPNFYKPNMVTCSFGIDAATTRCFNWFSMEAKDEYVWIREQGTTTWNKFESYKTGDGSNEENSSSSTSMYRKKFKADIINNVYARIDNTFPGNTSYTYRVHKCVVFIGNAITSGNLPKVYEYVVGLADSSGNPLSGKVSDTQIFIRYPEDWTPRVYHITDLQGFGWMEYQVWASAAEELNNRIFKECTENTKLFPILINTGDMTQNGTRVNEWLDYYNGGYSLFSHIEQMNVVGNNDLCNSYSEKFLGNGDDVGKSSPYYFHVFYCYEVPNDVTTSGNWKGGLIYNNTYLPSTYYFYFKNYAYLMVNSELTETTCLVYFNAISGSGDSAMPINLYTGFVKNGNSMTESVSGYLSKTLESWITSLNNKIIIAACHEMPFTVTTADGLSDTNKAVDRSISGTSLVGSHLNRISANALWDNDNNYWFSNLLQTKGIKLCIGGHKHTYAITYPVAEVATAKSGVALSKSAKIKVSSLITTGTNTDLWQTDNTLSNGVVYCMLQATGYKNTSNKELPSPSLNYSYIVPKTYLKTDGSWAADESQKYPMYATYEYKLVSGVSGINISIYRVVNIASENISGSKASVNTFNQLTYSSNPMYSELLVIRSLASNASYEDRIDKNYWLVPTEHLTNCPSYNTTSSTIVTTLRCFYDSTDSKYKGFIYGGNSATELSLDSTSYTYRVTL